MIRADSHQLCHEPALKARDVYNDHSFDNQIINSLTDSTISALFFNDFRDKARTVSILAGSGSIMLKPSNDRVIIDNA